MKISVICNFCDKDVEYLKRILHQAKSFNKDFEFIFVDDRKDKSIKVDVEPYKLVTYEGNIGTFHARKKGFESATGDYIWFIDVDDEIMPFTAETENCDVILYDWFQIQDGISYKSSRFMAGIIYNDSEEHKQDIVDTALGNNALWDKLYKREIIEKVYEKLNFTQRCIIYEDMLIGAWALEFVKSVKIEKKQIYKYYWRKYYGFSDYPKEKEFLKNHLPEVNKKYYLNLINENISSDKVDTDPRYKNKSNIKANFILDKKCNKNCVYCNTHHISTKLTDDKMFENFDRCLTRAERINKLNWNYTKLKIGLLGGEPTLWSSYLIKKIQERLKNYDSYTIFTNGSNKKSLWYKDSKAKYLEHVIDWKNKKLKKKDRTIYAIVLCHNEIEDFEKFLELNEDVEIALQPCVSEDRKLNFCFNDLEKLSRIKKDYKCLETLKSYIDLVYEKGILFAQAFCRGYLNVWSFDCETLKASACCTKMQQNVFVDDFWGREKITCGDCLWLC